MKVGIAALLAVLGCISLGNLQVTAFAPGASRAGNARAFATTLFAAPELLASEGEWGAYLDEENTGVVYYFNSKTGESLWEPPTKSFPEVSLSGSLKRKADAKKAEYYQKMRQEEKEEEKPGFFSRFMKPEQEMEETPKPAVYSDTSLTAAPAAKEKIAAEAVKKAEQAKPGATINLFGMEFGLPTETKAAPTPAPEPVPVPAPAAKSKEEIAKEAAKRAASAKPGASINIFGMEIGIPSFQEEFPKSTTKASSETAPAPSPAPAPVDKSKQERAAEALKKAEEAKPGATINLFGMEFGIPSMGQSPSEAKTTATSSMAQGQKTQASQKPAPIASNQAKVEPKKQTAEEEKIIVEEKVAPITIDIGSCVLPHPSKVMWGGEDAVFAKGTTFGVFDGVSGADKTDGMPLYSKLLARQMTTLVGPGNNLSIKDLQAQLSIAAEKCDASATGASTAIVASITDDGYLRAINLGDSYCIVIRDNKVVAKTKEIVHYFDCPYQLSEISPDRPRDARKLTFELKKGDIICMASDGVFDNLEEAEIIEIASSSDQPNKIAKLVADRSRRVSLDSTVATPYSRQAKRNGDPDFKDGLGGKVDDISCVVARYG